MNKNSQVEKNFQNKTILKQLDSIFNKLQSFKSARLPYQQIYSITQSFDLFIKIQTIGFKVVIHKLTKSLCKQSYMSSDIFLTHYNLMSEQLVSELEGNFCNLTRRDIGEVEIQWLCSQNVQHIQTLRLSYNSIGPAPMIHFQNARWLSLRKLYLTETLIGDKGCKSLSRVGLDEIKQLYLSRNLISNAGAVHLSKGKWKQLQCIDLSVNKMGDNSVKTLIKSDWKQLQILWMSNMKLGFGQIMHYFTNEYAKLSCIFIDDYDLNEVKVDWFNTSINKKCPEITDCFRLQL